MNAHISPSRAVPLLAAASVVLLWGASYPAIGLALDHVDPVPLGAVRYAVAGLVFAVLLVIVRPRWPRGIDRVRALLSGALGIALYNILLNSGQASISAGAAAFIASTQPVVVAAVAALTLKERPGPLAWLGTAIALAGVAAIAAGQPGGLRFGEGASLVALAAVSSGLSFVLQRPLVARYGALTSAATTILSGALLLSPWLATGLAQVAASPASAVGAVLFLGLGSGVLGYLAWMRALDHFGASRAANLLYLIAPWAALLDAWTGGAGLTPSTWLGGFLALLGVALVQRRRASSAAARGTAPPGSPSRDYRRRLE